MVVCCLPFVSGCKQSECAISENAIDDTIYQNLPFEMPKVQQPVFPAYEVNISKFGAKGDGMTLNTKAINDAIKEVNQRGGGKVIIPEGTWLTGPIELLSNVNLYTERNALILFTGDFEAYPIIPTSFEGLETRRCQSPISARNAENIAITGYGIFDGNGDCWRPVKKEKLTASQWNKLVKSGGVLDESGRIWYPSEGSIKGAMACKNFNVPEGINTDEEWNSIRDWLRPVLLSFIKCKKVLLEGVTFKNSPSWCLHPLSCEDITINNISVSNPWYSQNGDALDLESCNRALIQNSSFDAGDDGICIKSGKDEDGRRRGEPCQNVIIRNNVIRNVGKASIPRADSYVCGAICSFVHLKEYRKIPRGHARLSILNNRISDSPGAGIALCAARDSVISGNIIENTAYGATVPGSRFGFRGLKPIWLIESEGITGKNIVDGKEWNIEVRK